MVPIALIAGTIGWSPPAGAADACSASAGALILRSAGGTCTNALEQGEEFTLTYKITNLSIVDEPNSPNDGTLVAARIAANSEILATLAQQTADVGSIQLPGTLTFVPVCPLGSTGGTLAPGDPCDPLNNQCGSGECGCVSSLPGVGCHRTANPNVVHIAVTSQVDFTPGQQRTLARIRVKTTGSVPPPAPCGLFYTRLDSASDFLVTNDPACATQVTAGAQASADCEAPECFVDTDCGDPQCNQCVSVGTDNHCAPRAANTSCGIDSQPGDCLLPGCVINQSNVGVCTQSVVDAPQDTACTLQNGVPVPTVECETPQCNATGTCRNVADSGQNGDACGTDQNTGDCKAPACLAGLCTQGQINVAQGTACASDSNVCTDDLCDANGVCQHTDNTVACDTGLFCTSGDFCAAGTCTSSLVNCSDNIACTEDTCDEDLKACIHTPHDLLCDDGDACTVDTCSATNGCTHTRDPNCTDICRSPGYWATHSGYEKSPAVNVGQLVIDRTGPLEICGQTITSTSNHSSPYLSGLGLSSDLEALCMKAEGVRQRQLYRQLVAAALNCAISGQDCDAMTSKYIDVSFNACNDLCAGSPAVGGPTLGQCVSQLDCFNNGGHLVDGKCAYGTCQSQPDITCTLGSCPDFNGQPQKCVRFPDSCELAPMCNQSIGVCPKGQPASSSLACNEASQNSCTIDSCN